MIRRRLRSFGSDRRGAVAPMVAIMGTALIGTAGIALDIGAYYTGNRDLQQVTEAAALSAAVDPTNATSRAQAFLVSNGYPASVISSVEVGRYCADVTLAASARFFPAGTASPCPGNGLNTAVRLKTTAASKQYLLGVLGSISPIPAMAATATAARIDEAGVEMTSGVLGLNTGLVNSLLSLLSGSNIALTQTQFNALIGSNIDAGLMFDALAARVGETGTYSDLVSRTVSLADLLAACQTSLGASGDPATIDALQTLSSQLGTTIQIPLSGLFGLGVWKKMPVGGSTEKPSLRAGLNAYQLIAYALQTNNRSATLSNLTVGVAGVASVQLAATASGPLERPRFSFGPQGETTAGTSAFRLLLKIKVANLGTLLSIPGLNGLTSDIPLLIDIGSGTTSVTSISCGQESATDARVAVTSSAGLLNAYIGTLPSDAMTQPFRTITPADVTPVNLVNVPLVATIGIRATVGPIIGGSGALDFRQISGGSGVIGHPPLSGSAARVGSGSMLTPLLSGLGTNLTAQVCVPLLGLLGAVIGTSCVSTGSTVSAVTAPVANILTQLAVDPLVDGLLGALGVQAGFADTWVTGVRCGVPVLV